MNTTPDHPDTEPLGHAPATDTPDGTASDTVAGPAAPARHPRRAPWIITAGAIVLAAVATGAGFAITTAVQHSTAIAAFERAVTDRADAYTAQDDALTALTTVEGQAVVDYTHLRSIGTTLTDGTVADPATRTAVVDTAAELAQAAWIELDPAGAAAEEQAPLLTGLVPATPLDGLAPAADIDALAAQTADLIDDAEAVESYTDLITGVTAEIEDATDAGVGAADASMGSAAAKGKTLVYSKAPAQTKTVTTAAAALTGDDAADAPLEDKAALVKTYIDAVNAAWAQQKKVIAAEKADADRAAREQQQQRENESRNNSQNGSWNGGSNPGGSTGGGNPGGGSNPGNGGSNPGNGGGSNWQPLKLVVTGSTCSTTSGQEVTYGSTINVPGVNLDTYSTYEIPGYGWGATWKCKYW